MLSPELKHRILGQGTMEKSQSVKCLSPKHDDLNSTSPNPHKTTEGVTYNPTPREAGQHKPQQVLASQTE